MFSTLQSGLADLCWLWSCCKVPRSFFVQLMFSDDLQVINTGVLNMYEWDFFCLLMRLILYPLLWKQIWWAACINQSHRIGCLNIHRRSSLMRASVSVRWSRVTMCSRRRAVKSRASGRSASPELHWIPLRISQGSQQLRGKFKNHKPSKWWWLQAVWCVLWYSSPLMM